MNSPFRKRGGAHETRICGKPKLTATLYQYMNANFGTGMSRLPVINTVIINDRRGFLTPHGDMRGQALDSRLQSAGITPILSSPRISVGDPGVKHMDSLLSLYSHVTR